MCSREIKTLTKNLNGFTMLFHKMRVLSVAFIALIFQSSSTTSVTKIKTYSSTESNSETEKNPYQISSLRRVSRNDKKNGNVIFNDSFAFSSSSEEKPDNSKTNRNTRNPIHQTGSQYFPSSERDFLQNHRFEETLSPELTSSAAAGAISSPYFISQVNLKSANDVHGHNNENTGEIKDASDIVKGRTFLPTQYHGGNGWASNSGACLFSCGGFGGSAPSCCQLNYVQCCPNAHHEQLNFKNLHHGRGHLAGAIGKSGYAWGSLPYNPPPIVRPKPCQPQYIPPHYNLPHPGVIPPYVGGGGSIIHKGFQTIKQGVHNIGQIFKDHAGVGWTSGGNGAAGYYFHRRSDTDKTILTDETRNQYFSNPSKKSRPTRSVHKGFDQVAVPCPVYSIQPDFGWPVSKPHSVGIGSLIGWSKPGNQFHQGFVGGGAYGYGGQNHYQSPGISYGNGYGWGGSTGPGFGSPICKWDFDCPGILKCCKGVCQVPPKYIH